MKSKALAVQPLLQMTEIRAQWCQVSGRSSRTRIGRQDQRLHRERLVRSPLYLIFAIFLALPIALSAQTQQRQWSDLSGLKVGQGIDVIETSMKSHGGTFVSVYEEAITLREKDADVSVKRENVARVSTTSGARRGEHAAIGLVAGGLIGAGIGAASGSKTGFFGGSSRGIAALVGVVIGAPSGAAVGACVPAHTTIYRAARVPAAP